ncbi:ABC transporter permease [Microbacterium sp. NPDC058389]|uniref:ABC transporter permease n=1 Tax=Microbacterium sp. NPDC058389 TaxID=3346475 RepID=UPI003657B986
MASFIIRRLIASIFVLFAATFLMYLLVAYSGDPLEDLRLSNAPNKESLIEARTRLLNLDVPPPLRYFLWLGGIFRGDFGISIQNQPVNALLGNAITSTLTLVTTATVVAMVLGITVGIVSALRQYTGFDYSVTLIAFLFFSLPIFWVAVLLKQYGAIQLNDWLADPTISVPVIVGLSIVSGLLWMSILGGRWRKRLTVFGISAVATAAVLTFLSVTQWFADPSIGIVVYAFLALGIAVGVTAISTGLRNRKALYASLIVAVIGIALYFPMMNYILNGMTLWFFLLLAVIAVVVSGAIGWFMGAPDRGPVVRTTAIVGFFVAAFIALDKYMSYWHAYANSSRVRGRPIATVGSSTPGLGGNFWVQGIDLYTHLLLPTIAIILISFASYTRYSRASLLEVMNQDYIRTARSKGLTERTVVVRHAFRNALIPITTIIAFDVGALIGGAVITETVFGWVGMGRLFVTALGMHDPNPVMAFFVVTGTLAVIFNLIADLVYAALDPRIKVG